MTTRYHAEHVGSLLRPPELVEARRARSLLDPRDDRLRELEDRAVLDALEPLITGSSPATEAAR